MLKSMEMTNQYGPTYNLYQLIQSVGKDQYCNISPKGLSGEGYEGHYFGIPNVLSTFLHDHKSCNIKN